MRLLKNYSGAEAVFFPSRGAPSDPLREEPPQITKYYARGCAHAGSLDPSMMIECSNPARFEPFGVVKKTCSYLTKNTEGIGDPVLLRPRSYALLRVDNIFK